jgi:hypothetical protein
VFTSAPGRAAAARKLTVFFKGDALERFEGDEMPSEANSCARSVKAARLKVPVLEATEEQLLKFPVASSPAEPRARRRVGATCRPATRRSKPQPLMRPPGAAAAPTCPDLPMTASTSPLRVAVAGASGRMGHMLIEAVRATGDCVLAGALDRAGQPGHRPGRHRLSWATPAACPVTADLRAGLRGARC